MELLALFVVVLGLFFAARLLRRPAPHVLPDAAARQARLRLYGRQRRAREQAQRLRSAYRNMQVAILQLGRSPDFRRAASFAAHAQGVPLSLRQRQFRRLRPLLVRHLANRITAGVSAESAAAGLSDLVAALGMADYEAEYVVNEASRRGARPAAAPELPFADRVRQWQAEHQQRLEAIRGLSDLEPEVREQLLELEEQRFRDRLLGAGQPDGASSQVEI